MMSQPSTRRELLGSLSVLGTLGSGLLAASSTFAQTSSKSSKSNAAPNAPRSHNSGGPPKLAVVLGSGAARGFAHIGVIKAFDAAGIKPKIIVGTSAGSLVGALWAAGLTGTQIEDTALKVKDADIIDLATLSKRGLVSGDAIEQLVNQMAKNRPIEQLPIKYASVATVLRTGEMSVMQEGDLGFAVHASCSIPGLFLPAKKNGIEYIDGGLVSPLPVKVARQLGADMVVAIDVNSSNISVSPQGLFEQIMHSFDIMGRSLSRLEADQADIVVRPEMARIASSDFGSRANSIQQGFIAGQRMAPVIIEKLAQLNNRVIRGK